MATSHSTQGLLPHEYLTLDNISIRFAHWKTAMLKLFLRNGVLDIMKDAVNEENRRRRVEIETRTRELPRLVGAEVLDTAEHLADFEYCLRLSERDTELLCRADALIDASIGGDLHDWLITIKDPHTKWRALEEMSAVCDNDDDVAVEREIIYNDGVRMADYTTVAEYVHAAMQVRAAKAAASEFESLNDHPFKRGLVREAATVIPGLKEALGENLKLSEHPREYGWNHYPGDKLTVPGFAVLFIQKAQQFWDAQRGLGIRGDER